MTSLDPENQGGGLQEKQRGQVVRAPDLKSVGLGFKSHYDR